jgi:hypothetical protein
MFAIGFFLQFNDLLLVVDKLGILLYFLPLRALDFGLAFGTGSSLFPV